MDESVGGGVELCSSRPLCEMLTEFLDDGALEAIGA